MVGFSHFYKELRRRKVISVAVLYFISSWLILQVASLAFESWGLSQIALRYIWIGAFVGFPLAVIFGWRYDIADGRIIRTPPTQIGNEPDYSLAHFDYMLLGAMTIILAVVVYLVYERVQTEGNEAGVKVSVATWPAADMLFRRDPLWLGGDGSVSVDLGAGRVLWLFSDSFIASQPGQRRAEATFISNSVAVQQGHDPSSATIRFYWRTEGLTPMPIFREKDGFKYWPTSAILLGRSLLIFLVEVRSTTQGLGFELTGMAAFIVDNPEETPAVWRMREVSIPPNESNVLIGYSGLVRKQDYLYAYSKQEQEQDPTWEVYLVRWPVNEASKGNLEGIEWWSGDVSGWVPADQQAGIARPIFSETPLGFSIQYYPKQKIYMQLQTWGFGSAAIAVRTSATLTGPWSERQIVFWPEEARKPNVFIYGGRAHSHLIGADIVATYDVNSSIFSNLLSDQSIYYPRFIRLNFEKN